MKNLTLKSVIGAFRILRRRATAVGQPSLSVWTDAGEQAAHSASRDIVVLAHRNECTERALAGRVREIIADGKLTRAELRELSDLPGTLTQCAERSHDITEIAAV